MLNNIHKLYMESLNDKELEKYLYNDVLKRYKDNGQEHRLPHIKSIMHYAEKYAKVMELRKDLAITIGAYHDLGLINVDEDKNRKDHPKESKKIVLNDDKLKRFFNEDEIKIIAQACYEHSSSLDGDIERSEYGKLIRNADKSDKLIYEDLVEITRRYVKYSIKKDEDLTDDELFEETIWWIQNHYIAKNKISFVTEDVKRVNEKELERTKRLSQDMERSREIFDKINDRLKKEEL